jgi:hypothetical protein
MIDLRSLIGKCLVAVQIGHNHDKVHPAWRDETNKGFLICYDINLVFQGQESYSIKPCEVDITDRFPGLGLLLEKVDTLESSIPFNITDLPLRISEIAQSDHLSEDVINQYVFVLENGSSLVIRHVFPPMTLGINVVSVNA